MSWADPIADMLVRIQNGQAAKHQLVDMPHSKIKEQVARILKAEGYLAELAVEADGRKKTLRLYLKYTAGKRAVITGMKRVSRSGRRMYVTVGEIPRVLGGMGIAVLSTPAGVLTGQEARRRNVGGEVICTVW